MRLLPVGPAAWLIEAGEHTSTEIFAALQAVRPPSLVDAVPAEASILARFSAPVSASDLRVYVAEGLARSAETATGLGPAEPCIVIPVRYHGPDLSEVAALLGFTPEELVARHQAARWSVAFTGFAPGFAYLRGPRELQLPRRDQSRPSVPAGSVALGGGYCGVYPRVSPGGWHLIGTTDAVLWDVDRPQPALLTPGAQVRFTDQASPDAPSPAQDPAR